MKTCTHCHTEKELSCFGSRKNVNNTDKPYYNSICKPCMAKRTRDYKKTPKGRAYSSYVSQVTASKKRGHRLPNYTQAELYEWMLNNGLLELMVPWKASGYDKWLSPSVDRLDNTLPYTLDNLELVTWEENDKRAKADRAIGRLVTNERAVTQLTKQGELIAKFPSIVAASKYTGIGQSNISECLTNPKCSTAGGFIWIYTY